MPRENGACWGRLPPADHIDSVFGPDESKLHGYPGHPEIELALMRLYEVTEEPRYGADELFCRTAWCATALLRPEYEKRGQTSHWHTYGPAWMVKDKAYSRTFAPLRNSKPPSVTRYVLSI